MDGGSKSTDARVAALERAVRALELRVDAIAPLRTAPRLDAAAEASDSRLGTSDFPSLDPVASLTLVGRTLVLLGGAYLLRALTDAGVLPVTTGVALGFAYASIWLVVADRLGAAQRAWSAIFYAATTTVIALPLLFEAMTRFAIVGAVTGAGVLMSIACAALLVAVRARLHVVAWIVMCGAVAASLAITAATGFVLPFAVADIGLGVVTLWIGYTLDWTWLRWVPAVVADLAVLSLAIGVAVPGSPNALTIVAAQLLLFTAYFTSISVRTLARERDVNVFEVAQGAATLAIGFVGAVYVAHSRGWNSSVGGAGLICGLAAYAVAFAFVARRQGLHRNFYFYTSIALVMVLASTATWQPSAALVWAVLAVLASWTAARTDHFALRLHAAIYIAAASIGSGLIGASTIAFIGVPGTVTASATVLAVFAAACACWAAPDRSDGIRRLPRAIVALLAVWSAAAALIVAVGTFSSDPGVIATVRTAVLAAAAIGAAALGRLPRFREASWLVYPVLIGGGAKLLFEDLPRSRPATLFIALAAYGVALIVAPRLARPVTRPAVVA